MTKDEKINNMAACLLSIYDTLKLHDNEQGTGITETLSEEMFRIMKAHNVDLNKQLGFTHLKPVASKK
ncbi:MAG: hypothetical protein COB15_09665 [Flavobacteriales bacterium]|jgi:hypothetical protein|nr:MAG: hypothetical protein COB15_09665 [Flavobacteriales bacterium]